MSQTTRQLAYNYYQQTANPPLSAFLRTDVQWHGPCPFDDLSGIEAVQEHFWQPLHTSFTRLRRRMDIFIGGTCEGQTWFSSTGYFIGHFEQDWLGIPATGRQDFLRYGEFCRVEAGQISEIYLLLDIVDLATRAGKPLLPPSAGLVGFVPPPRTGEGVLLEPAPEEGQRTFDLAYEMLFGGLNQFEGDTQQEAESNTMGLRRYWHPDMHWYGPAGIGTTRNLSEFQQWHQYPWLHAFPDRKVIWESPMFGDGHYAATAGWREVVATHTGEYLGHTPTNQQIEFRVMDWWRREGDLLAENWVLIDLLDAFRQMGMDLLA